MAIIVGGDPRAEKQEPVALPESKIKRDVEPVEIREAEAAQSEKPEEEAVEASKKPVKKARKNGKK